MTDSPASKIPIDPSEQPILDNLLVVRDKLLLLKADRSQYVKSQDVLEYYDKVLLEIGKLNQVRADKPREQNRLDKVLDDCLQLISLFFLTIGRNAEAPAAEAGFFSGKDLVGLENQLNNIQESVHRGRTSHSEDLIRLLETRLENCKLALKELKATLSLLPPDLVSTHEKLVSILRTLSSMHLKQKIAHDEVRSYQKLLREIGDRLGHVNAMPVSDLTAEEQYTERLKHLNDTHPPLPGKELVVDLLQRTMLWSEVMLHRKERYDERFKEQFTELANIYRQLEKLSLTQAWSLRETDLYSYQRALDRVDESRVDGNFVDATGKPAEVFEQRALLYLLRKSYATMFYMLTSSEPVSEALLPIYNQLTTLKKCLVEVQRTGGVNSPRELYPYSMKLTSIDNMRKDGKFMVNGDIPEGQGSVSALLHECFELAYELRNNAEREEYDEADGSDDDQHDLADETKGVANLSIGVN